MGWMDADRVLRGRAPFDLGYRPMTLQDVATDPVDDKLVLLRGPRRVGKSVLLKDTIAALCRRPDLDARQIIYLPCDGMKALDLNRVEKLGRDLTRSVGDVRRIWLRCEEKRWLATWRRYDHLHLVVLGFRWGRGEEPICRSRGKRFSPTRSLATTHDFSRCSNCLGGTNPLYIAFLHLGSTGCKCTENIDRPRVYHLRT